MEISQRIDLAICDNQWHEFSVLMGTTHFILRLDDIHREIPVQIPKDAIEVLRSLPVHVGGLSRMLLTSGVARPMVAVVLC